MNLSRFHFIPIVLVLLALFLFFKISFNNIEILNFHIAFFTLCLAVYCFYKIFLFDKYLSVNLILALLTSVIILSLSFLVFRYSFRLRTSAYWKLIFDFKLEAGLYIYMGICIFIFTFIDMAINKKHFSNYIFLIVFIASYIMFLLYAVNNNIKEAHYTLSKPLQYKSEKGLKIAHVSDLHNTIHNNSQKDLTDRIRGYNPDLIFLTGDIADDKFDFNGTLLFLEQTKDVAPIYYVTGNHEYWSSSLKQNIESMEQYGLKYLDNQTEKININGEDITITGINDPSSYEPATSMDKIKFIDEALKGQDYEQESLNLLLFHRPEYVDIFNKYNFDIIFAGHAHGGQITLPFLVNGFYAPNQGFFPKYAGGLYELLNSSLVVSRGLSIHYLPRIFNPPELVFVTVTN